jgi:HlyD family secretion protein
MIGNARIPILILLAWIALNLVACRKSSAPVVPYGNRSSPSGKISCVGRIEPKNDVVKIAASPYFGQSVISQLLVKEGDDVKMGQELAVLDSHARAEAEFEQIKSQMKVAESRLAELLAGRPSQIEAQKADVSRLTAQSQLQQKERDRIRKLHERGVISTSEMDAQQTTAESAEQGLRQAEETLSSMTKLYPVELKTAEAHLREAEANMNRAKIVFEMATVRSPISGRVLKIHAHPGERVDENGVLEIGDLSQMYVVAEVYETDVRFVKVGQSAKVTSTAFEGEILGTVEQVGWKVGRNDVLHVDPAANADLRVVEVKIRLDDAHKAANLIYLQANVLIIP